MIPILDLIVDYQFVKPYDHSHHKEFEPYLSSRTQQTEDFKYANWIGLFDKSAHISKDYDQIATFNYNSYIYYFSLLFSS